MPATSNESLENNTRARIAGRILISILAIAIDVWLVPNLYVTRTFYALIAFALLCLVGHISNERLDSLPRLVPKPLATFVGLHALLVIAAIKLSPSLGSATGIYTSAASLLSLTKILLLLPTLVLFWDPTFLRRYASEATAAVVVLFTFFPDRYVHSIWPIYARLLTHGLATFGGAFVPGTLLAETSSMFTVTGPSVIMLVDFQCSGITGIELFQNLFLLIAIVEWNRLDKRRALICYVLGLITYIAANFLRLVLLYVIGNRLSHHPDLDSLGWVLFVITFIVIMKASYAWIVGREPSSTGVDLAKTETA